MSHENYSVSRNSKHISSKTTNNPGHNSKILHPLVLKIQSELNQPSPCYLVKDQEQPSEGYLKQKRFAPKTPERTQKCVTEVLERMKDKLDPIPITDDVWMVPCMVVKSQKEFNPICRPFGDDTNWQKVQSRQPWLSQEDEALQYIIEEQGIKSWSVVARELNKRAHRGVPVRQGKQCRERYYNHIDPRLVKGNWTIEEDLVIMEQQQLIGNKWSQIASILPGRTENQVKNRFKSLLKKGMTGCPKGLSPIAHLLMKTKENSGFNPSSGASSLVSSSVTPSTYMTSSAQDLSFSCWADRFNSFAGPPPKSEATPSPSTMLFFHKDNK